MLALAAVTATVAQAAQAPIHVQGFAKIGSFRVEGADPASARRAFGKPTSTRDFGDSCVLTRPGLAMGFYTLLHEKQCRDDTPFSDATISRPWVTDRGLRQGDTVARAKKLYPDARKAGRSLGVTGLGLIVKTFPAIGDYGLAVKVKDGRVTVLDIFYPQGGE